MSDPRTNRPNGEQVMVDILFAIATGALCALIGYIGGHVIPEMLRGDK